MTKWQKFFQALLLTEETVLPVFIHNPQSQKVTGVILMAESIFGQAFGLTPPPPTPPAPPAA